MIPEQREAISQKINEAEYKLEQIQKTANRIAEIDKAIRCLTEDRRKTTAPAYPDVQAAFTAKMEKMTKAYDDEHQPKRKALAKSIVACAICTSLCGLPFLIELFHWSTQSGTEKIASLILGLLPVLISWTFLILRIYQKATYNARLHIYRTTNQKRLQAIEGFKPHAVAAANDVLSAYDKKHAQYLEDETFNQAIDEKIAGYQRKKNGLLNEQRREKERVRAIFDELETPKEYRDAHHLALLKAFFLVDAVIDMDENALTPKQSLQDAYESFRNDDADREIRELANRQESRERARLQREMEKEREKERAAEPIPPKTREGLWSDEELDEFAYIVNNQ